MTKFPNTEIWAREIKFKKFTYPKTGCSYCKHSYCHNPGAYITGLSCRKIDKLSKKKELPSKDDNGEFLAYTGLVQDYDICDLFE